MKKNFVRVIVILVLAVVPVWMFISKDKDFSDKENRYLADMPKISVSSIGNGSFMDDFETYLTDQFPLRDKCISIKTAILRLTGQRKINGVYIGSDGYLIAEESDYDEKKLKEIIDSVNYFAGNKDDLKINFMLVPNSISIYEDKLPYNVVSNQKETMNYIEENLSENISYIDIYDTLKNAEGQQMYYKTDHHWTTFAAYEAFKQFASVTGLNTDDVTYNFYTVTGEFQGTQASNSGVYNVHDRIDICVPEGSEGTYVVNYPEKTLKKASLFDIEKLNEKDKYLVFMGGNYSEADINTVNGTGRNLLVVKDSFANCMIPMFTPYYDKIVVVDPRYFYDNIYEVMEINHIDEVLFLYNVNSFVTDNSLKDILMNTPEE